MVGDGTNHYDHYLDGGPAVHKGCHAKFLNTIKPVVARITYINKSLQISLKIEDGDWEDCMSLQNVELPETGFIGFSARTGDFSARHEILAVTTAAIEMDDSNATQMHYIEEKRSLHLKPTLLFLALIAVALIVVKYKYQKDDAINAKNF